MKAVVVGGGIAGLAAARHLEQLVPETEIVILEREEGFGGKLQTERIDGFVIEGAADSFLTRKERGVGLCEELGLGNELVGRRPQNARTFVRRGGELHPLPSGLTGMIPTDLHALAESELLTREGQARLAAEVDLPPDPPDGDESIAAFISRRLGREAYEALVEPLMTGIYGGDGDRLSLRATFPGLRELELEHGSLLRGLQAQPGHDPRRPPFLSLEGGMDTLSHVLVAGFSRTRLITGKAALCVSRLAAAYEVELDGGDTIEADGVVLAVPAFTAAELLAGLDPRLAAELGAIEYASSVVVTLAYREEDVPRPLDGYGYVVPRGESTDVLACTWTSSKWEGRAPAGKALIRVYAGRHGGRDVTADADDELVALARDEVRILGIESAPSLVRVHRWPRGMPQYLLGHPERVDRIEGLVQAHPGLALAGAAYRGVGISDCIRAGEDAAEAVAHALAGVRT